MSDRTETRELSHCICMRLRRAARRVTRIYDRALEPIGLTSTQYNVLSVIAHREGRPIGALADYLGMDPTTLTRTLRPLVAQKLVQNAPDPSDGRVRAIVLTKQGRARFRRGIPFWRAAQRQMTSLHGGEAAAERADLVNASIAKRAS
jgi:DNA-binding MarR family transcriptional regulator